MKAYNKNQWGANLEVNDQEELDESLTEVDVHTSEERFSLESDQDIKELFAFLFRKESQHFESIQEKIWNGIQKKTR